MIFASAGGNIQNSLMARARKRAFMFDNTVQPETALTDPVTWVKNMVEARSVGYNISNNKLLGSACSGVISQQFYPADLHHLGYDRVQNSSAMFPVSDTLTAQQRALKFGAMSFLNGETTFANPLAGPLSMSNFDTYDTYTPTHLPAANAMKTALLPNKYASNYGAGGYYPAQAGSYNSSGSGSNNSWSYTFYGFGCNFNTEANTYTQVSVGFGSSTVGTLIRLFNAAPLPGMASVYGVQNYIYHTLTGTDQNNWTYSRPGNADVIQQQNAVVRVAVPYGATADTPAFDVEWFGCPVWNGEKISCEIFRKTTDFTNGVQQQTNVQPDISFVSAVPAPSIATRISV